MCKNKKAAFNLFKDQYTGNIFGKLLVLECFWSEEKHQILCKCQCSCDNHTIVNIEPSNLYTGNTTSCGCDKHLFNGENAINLVGQKFGHLTVLEKTSLRSGSSVKWKCQCDCKNKTICYVSAKALRRGEIISCGCMYRRSKGAEKIANLLIQNQINFIQEYTFDKCINPETNYKLRFDFYLPDYNCCIEYDGEQHFKPKTLFGGQKGFQDLQKRDIIKNEYCKENNIKLVRIPYIDYEKIDFSYLEIRIFND